MKMLVFTDLDGTLLDPVSYSFADAAPALGAIHLRNVPLVLCTSKTRAELVPLRRHLRNSHPFISENGGGVFIPEGYFSMPVVAPVSDGYQLITLGESYAVIRREFVNLREKYAARVRGFADMTAAEVAELTGLSLQDSILAKQRDFDEPFIFEGDTDEDFLRGIEELGLKWTQGQIFHIMGKHDKGKAVRMLTKLYEREYGAVTSIGLGDSLNDLPMLQSVDQPVLVRHADGSFDPRVDMPGLFKTRNPGPLGWNEVMLSLLAQAEAQ